MKNSTLIDLLSKLDPNAEIIIMREWSLSKDRLEAELLTGILQSKEGSKQEEELGKAPDGTPCIETTYSTTGGNLPVILLH